MGSLGGRHIQRAAGAPETLLAYLQSISKGSFLGFFQAGVGMWTGTTKNGSPVTLGVNVGSWDYDPSQSYNWSAYWTQAGGAAAQPFYQTANGVNCLIAPTNNPLSLQDSRFMNLSDVNAVNGPYSVIVSMPLLERDARTPYCHGSANVVYFVTSTGAGNLFNGITSSGTSSADQVIHSVKVAPGTSSGKVVLGLSQTLSTHNGSAPLLLKRSSSYSSTGIDRVAFCPQLTRDELAVAVTYF